MKIVVTGAAGLLGGRTVGALRERGHEPVGFDLRDSANTAVVGDLNDAEALGRAMAGADAVIHCAAYIDWSAWADPRLQEVNVDGTRSVIDAAQAAGVSTLVFVSSAEAVWTASRELSNVDESLGYHARYGNPYGASKAEAERLVLAANSSSLSTCALRMGGIWGPGDRLRFRQQVLAAKRARRAVVGDGSARFSHVFVGNLAHALVLAAEQLGPEHPGAGRPFFVDDKPAKNFFAFFEPFLDALGLEPREIRIAAGPLRLLGDLSDLAYTLLGRHLPPRPDLCRFSIDATVQDYWFNTSAFREAFGYEPPIPFDDASAETVAWLREAFDIPAK
jgi:nucleoside-diphosphate-sugar epimerase